MMDNFEWVSFIVSFIISIMPVLAILGVIVYFYFKYKSNWRELTDKMESVTLSLILTPKVKMDEAFAVEAVIEESWGRVHESHLRVKIIVKYEIENIEYKNKVVLEVNPIGLDSFKRGSSVNIMVDKQNYNKVGVEPKWLYDCGAMIESDYIILKRKNQI